MGGKRSCTAQPPVDHAFVKTTKPKAAAAARIGAALARRKRAELLELLRPCFARTEPWLQAGKYAAAVMCDPAQARTGGRSPSRSGDRTPDRTQRLLNRAVWDTFAAMGVVRRFAVAGLDEAARKAGRRRGLAVGAIDETGQVKAGARPPASSGSTWAAWARWPTGSTPCTCRMCGKAPGTR